MSDKKRFVFAERNKALHVAATCGLSVIAEQQELTGYQLYIVEQWVCDRRISTNVVKVFTGDESHKIQVAVIAISTAELQHPRPQVQSILNLSPNLSSHLKLKPTPLGEILLTDPSELPFDMDMILVPDGDYEKWIKQAYVNINLRRTNCTGRSSLNLRPPNPASEEKFRSSYKIADTVDFQNAVIKLVSLVQISLHLFKLLDKDWIDGLICDETNKALWTFYTKYEPIKTTEFALKEPWMEPHLMAAIISKLVVCRNKLQDTSFTTVKDPFQEFESFRFDIGDYQRYKNIRPTKFIDLDTLAKLNEYTFSQLKVHRAIKSKLDDISGTTNSPLFNETSDPEVFKHHATIDSLRTIWRPKLRGVLGVPTGSGSGGGGPLIPSNTLSHNYGEPNEFVHLIKGVSRSGGAALSRVAGSIPWISTDNNKKQQHSQFSPNSAISSSTVNIPSLEYNYNNQSHTTASSIGGEREVAANTTTTVEDTSKISNNNNIPARKPSPFSVQTSLSSSREASDSEEQEESDISPLLQQQAISPDHLDQDIPSYVQSVPQPASPASATSPMNVITPTVQRPPKLRISKSSDTTHQQFRQGDFVPYIMKKSKKKSSTSVRHVRSASDSLLLDPLFQDALVDKDKKKAADTLRSAFSPYQSTLLLKHKRSLSQPTSSSSPSSPTTATAAQALEQQRPKASMNIQTYMTFEKLVQQYRALQTTYTDLKSLADTYENTATDLRLTFEKRSKEFDVIQKESRSVLEEQNATERRLKDVEDNSAKLHYELKVLNDKLKDIEDNVGMFYGKVGALERKMDDSQQSITTMLIIGNYFNHYWVKVRNWTNWFTGAGGVKKKNEEGSAVKAVVGE